MPVIPKRGGPWSLYCTDCGVWTPNTANTEMMKEGFYASGHICRERREKHEVGHSGTVGVLINLLHR